MKTLAGAAAAVVLSLGLAATAGAQGKTAPAYPGNTVSIADDPIVAGTVHRAHLSGHADWGDATDDITIGFDLSLFVQDASVSDACEPWYSGELQKLINLEMNPTTGFSEEVMDGANLNPAPPAPTLDWKTETAPFVVRPGVDRVVLCAYQRYVTDDVATYERTAKVDKPACTATQRRVRRGHKLRLKCNLSGKVTLKFTRTGAAHARTVRTTVDSKGRGKASTSRLRRGSYRVRFAARKLALGRDHVTVR